MWAIALPLTLLALVVVVLIAIAKQHSFEESTATPRAQPSPTQKDTAKRRPAEIEKAESPPPQTPTEIIAAAVSSFQTGNVELSNKLLAAVDLDKAGSSLGWELAGLLSENANNREEADKIYSHGIVAVPTAGLYYRRALLNRETGDPEVVLKDFDAAIHRAPADIVISNERLLFLIRIGRGRQVHEELEKFHGNPGKADARSWIFAQSALAMEDGNYARAAQLLTEAKRAVDPRIFEMMLKNTVISSHMTHPEVMPFYIRNISPK